MQPTPHDDDDDDESLMMMMLHHHHSLHDPPFLLFFKFFLMNFNQSIDRKLERKKPFPNANATLATL
jgi:hypothetical protein